MANENMIAIVDDDGKVRGFGVLEPMYIHTDHHGDTFITTEGDHGLEHLRDEIVSICADDCAPELTIIVKGDFS